MNRFSTMLIAAVVALAASVLQGAQAPVAPAVPAQLVVPAGFKVDVFARDVTNARLMAVSPDGVLFVARPSKGDVVALPDRDNNGQADSIDIVISNVSRPHSVAFNGGYLYVATNPAVLRVKYAGGGKVAATPETVIELPVSTTGHWTRTIGFGRDGKLYLSIGSSCNLCEDEDPRRSTIMVYNADGTGGRPYAKGLRNALGFDWDPSGVLWAGDMGEDKHGEEKPADEINRVEDGKHYGWPYLIDNNVPNTNLTDAKGSLKPADATPPAFALEPHASPIDLRFYTGRTFPAKYRGAMLVALHGSSATTRKERTPGKVVRVVFTDGKPSGVEDFVTGWLKDGQVLGRPAGLAVGADGALFISDDNKGFIYRVSYDK
jgi:glucose/arabinose dehydrogenase